MKRSPVKGGHSNLPVPKSSKGSPGSAKSVLKGSSHAMSTDDIPRRVQVSSGSRGTSPSRRLPSPSSKTDGENCVSTGDHSSATNDNEHHQAGVCYITEDLIRKISKEDNFETITSLNLTLSKEGGKKIKFIENLEKLKKLEMLNLSCNMIEKIENMDRLGKLRDLNLAYNSIYKIEGLENLINLQVLNLTGNLIEHIPIWMGKRLKSLRSFHISHNSLHSLIELSKLKSLTDLTHLTVSENPLSDLGHYQSYLVFHLRTIEILDSHAITEDDRMHAKERFSQGEVEKLEKQLEQEEARFHKLEEDCNHYEQEANVHGTGEQESRHKEKLAVDKIHELERELVAKSDLLKNKSVELSRACEKHYQLEQDMAFHKIDSKFESLGRVPENFSDMSGDDGGLEESPYLGRARYKANRFSQEGVVLASPQHAQSQSVSYLGSPQKEEMQKKLDQQLASKQDELAITEDRLRRLQDDLDNTEKKLLHAAKDIKQMGDMTHDEEFQAKLRLRLAKKMEMVNRLRDNATQIEDEIDKTCDSLYHNKDDVARLKGQLDRLDTKDPSYHHMYVEMVDKEQQINESNRLYGQLQQQLDSMLDRITTETEDIKKLEFQLNEEKIEQNDDLRAELDEIVGGLQGYLQNVQQQGTHRQQMFGELLSERENLTEKVRNLENDLSILNSEANNFKEMERRVLELEETLNLQQDLNKTLNQQLHNSHQLDVDNADKMENASAEVRQLQMSIRESDIKAQLEKQRLESQLAAEQECVHELSQKAKEGDNRFDEIRKLTSQLEKTKAQNLTLHEQLDTEKQIMDTKLDQSIDLKEMRKRLKELSHAVKTGNTPVEPHHEKDFLGKTFKDLQHYMHDKLNESMQEASQGRRQEAKAHVEIQTLEDQLKKSEARQKKIEDERKGENKKFQDDKKADEMERIRLQGEVQRLQSHLKDVQNRASQGMPVTRIVYAPGSETDRSSLNSEEKQILDDLQRELFDLKRAMRQRELDSEKRLGDAEAEAALMEEALHDRENYYKEELHRKNEEAELLRERHEARLQVIGQDLGHADQVANQLQQLLDEREQQLHKEMRQSGLSTHVVTNQEEELERLYEILDAQRDEIDYLNDHLDNLALRGGEVDPAFDVELWRLRQEVNQLKETLAMEKAYIHTMPHISAASTQVQLDAPTGIIQGNLYPTSRPYPVSTQNQGISTNRLQPSLTQYQGAPTSLVPPPLASQTVGTGYAPTTGQPGRFSTDPRHTLAGVAYTQASQQPYTSQAPVHQTEARQQSGDRLTVNRPAVTRIDRLQASGHRPRDHVDGDLTDRLSQRSRRSDGRRHSQRICHSSRSSQREMHPNAAFQPISTQTDHPIISVPVSNLARQDIGYDGSPLLTSSPVREPSGSPVRGIQGPAFTVTGASASQSNLEPGFNGHSQTLPVGTSSRFAQASTMEPFLGAPIGHSRIAPTVDPRDNEQPFPVPHQVLQTPGQPPLSPMYTTTMSCNRRNIPPSFQPPVTHPIEMPPRTSARTFPQSSTVYVPVEGVSSQPLGYKTGRRYLQAFSTSADRPAARIYYPPSGSIPLQMSVPNPQPSVATVNPSSPGPHVSFLPVEPLAAGTPVGSPSRMIGSFSLPPSPIRIMEMDSAEQPRGILKNPGQGVGDDSYLFCNVPEHHDLEDYIAELQDKVKTLKSTIARERSGQREASEESEYRVVNRLQAELEERRDELEGLDLAIERQTKNLKKKHHEEQFLKRERELASDELKFLRVHNEKLLKRRRDKMLEDDSDDSLENKMGNHCNKGIKDEMDCLEKTLTKRRVQLREADRLLKECNADLRDAKEEARQTVKQYEDATHSLKTTVDETAILEKRANKAGIELVKAAEQLSAIRSEVKGYEKKQSRQERLLKDVNSVIVKRDSEYKELDGKVKMANKNLQRVELQLNTSISREKELVETLRDSEEVLSKRRTEVGRMREQVDGQRAELEAVDQQMGKKLTELQFLKDSMEHKKTELSTILREAETEVTKKQNELKDQRMRLRELEVQKNDMNGALKGRHGELQKLKTEIEKEEEILQKLTMAVSKQKSELRHTYDMQKIEQTELDNLKAQHADKLDTFEKTQTALLTEKKELESLNAETSKKSVEVERLRERVQADRQEVEYLATKKHSLEDRITVMLKEKEMLDENCKGIDNKINEMKRSYHVTEEKMDNSSKQLEKVEQELQQTERELEDFRQQKVILQKEVHSLKVAAKDSKGVLKNLKENIREAEEQVNQLEMDLRETHNQRDDTKLETERLNEAIHQSRLSHDNCTHQQTVKQQDLEELICTIEQKENEYEETRKSLNRVHLDLVQEETRLSKLIVNANLQLDEIRSELTSKQAQLEKATNSLHALKNDSEKLHIREVKFDEMEDHIKKLEKAVFDRTEEKSELAKALTHSYEQLQKIRTESSKDREQLTRERLQFESALHDMQGQLEFTQQDMKQLDQRSGQQVVQLQNLAEQQFLRASQLGNELIHVKKNEARKKRIYEDGNKENAHITIIPESRNLKSSELQNKLIEEQEQLRYQLQGQMQRHASTMEEARLQSEGTIDNLRRKLNALQEVLVNSNGSSDVRAIQELTRVRSRSSSPGCSFIDGSFSYDRRRSPSPRARSYLAQRPKLRSKSVERIETPDFTERDFLCT